MKRNSREDTLSWVKNTIDIFCIFEREREGRRGEGEERERERASLISKFGCTF